MANEQAQEAQRLIEHYRQMYDRELLNLASQHDELTDVAKLALRDEMKRRGLDEPDGQQPRAHPASSNPIAGRQLDAGFDPSFDESEDPGNGEGVEFTWKTELCACNDWQQGQLLRETLYRAGIETWTEPPYARNYGRDFKILVAADQLGEALKIAENPIPQDVVDDSKVLVPEFEAPVCPRCGAADPLLEGVDGANRWLCEACESRWTDSIGDSKPAAAECGSLGHDEAEER